MSKQINTFTEPISIITNNTTSTSAPITINNSDTTSSTSVSISTSTSSTTTSPVDISSVKSGGSCVINISPGLLFYVQNDTINVSDALNPSIFFIGYIQTYLFTTGQLVIYNIIGVNGTLGTNNNYNTVVTSTTGSVTLSVDQNLLLYSPGNIVLVSDSTDPLNYFSGYVQSYTSDTGELIVDNIKSTYGSFGASVVYNLTVNPILGGLITLYVNTGLSYTIRSPVKVSDSTDPLNYFSGYIQSYTSDSGELVINNVQDINGSYGASVVYNVVLNFVLGGSVVLYVQPQLLFYPGNPVMIIDSTNPLNNFSGYVNIYVFGTGELLINNIQNINGSYGQTVIYNVNLYTPVQLSATFGYKNVYEPIIPKVVPKYQNIPSSDYGYKKFAWMSKTSMSNPLRSFSIGSSLSFTKHAIFPRRSSILTNNVSSLSLDTYVATDGVVVINNS